jgi:hypothetical protein
MAKKKYEKEENVRKKLDIEETLKFQWWNL